MSAAFISTILTYAVPALLGYLARHKFGHFLNLSGKAPSQDSAVSLIADIKKDVVDVKGKDFVSGLKDAVKTIQDAKAVLDQIQTPVAAK